jgi:malate/lactate dehydrogenase
MKTASQIINQESIEKRIWLYKHDGFIKGCEKVIGDIIMLSKPTIIITDGDWEHAEHKIDERSQIALDKWQKVLKDYIYENYFDIIKIN